MNVLVITNAQDGENVPSTYRLHFDFIVRDDIGGGIHKLRGMKQSKKHRDLHVTLVGNDLSREGAEVLSRLKSHFRVVAVTRLLDVSEL